MCMTPPGLMHNWGEKLGKAACGLAIFVSAFSLLPRSQTCIQGGLSLAMRAWTGQSVRWAPGR